MKTEIGSTEFDYDNLSFFQACHLSQEDDVLENVSWSTQRIVNNGGSFLWEEKWEPVKLRGEFMEARWKLIFKEQIE